MNPAATHFDPVIGIDVHIVQPPGPVPPVPVPHPYVGIVFDPFDYVPIVGSTVKINGMHRAIAGTAGKAMPTHIPIGGVFVKPPANEDENFMGSATVSMDGDAAAYMALPCLSCQCIGIPPPPRLNPKKKTKVKSLVAPTSVVLPIPKGPPVLIGGPPTISLMNIAMSLGMAGLARGLRRLARSGVARRGAAAFRRARQRIFRNMNSGFLKCTILRAEPVDVVTGEVVVDQLDFDIPARIPLRWTRHYRSGSDRVGHCGHGWETPADARLQVSPDGAVLFHDGAGVSSYFDRVPDHRPIRELVNGATLQRTEGHLLVRQKGGLSYYFPLRSARRCPGEIEVTAIMDACHNSWHFIRDGSGLASIVENTERQFDVHSEGGLIRRIWLRQDAGERHLLATYEYDGEQNLVAVRDAHNAPYRFAYDRHCLTSHTSRTGLTFHYQYDRYERDGRVVHTWGDGGLYDYRFVYDMKNRWTEITDSLGHISVVQYDERLLITRETDPLGRVTNYAYDEAGRTTEVVDPAGRLTAYDYDDAGNLLKLTRPDGLALETRYDKDGNPIEQKDAVGHIWKLGWDERGLLRGRISPRGGKWLYKHNVAGDLVLLRDAKGGETRFTYDRFGQIAGITDPLGNTQRFAFGPLGSVSSYTDGEGFRTRYEHDAKGRLRQIQSPSGATTSYEYDLDDNLVSVTDANGHTTGFRYFGLGEVAERHQADGTVVRYEYDTEERLTAVINEAGERYRLIRDSLGRVVEEIDYWNNPKHYRYNRAGNVVATKDALGRVVRFEHDALDRLVKRRFEDGSEETFAYDPNGNLTAAINQTIAVTRAYDTDGNMVRETQGDFVLEHAYDLLGNRTRRKSSIGHVVDYAFDAAGRASEIRLDGEMLARMHYDRRGLVRHEELGLHLQRDFEYDAEGMVARQLMRKSAVPLVDRRYTRDPIGSVLRRETRRGDEHHWVAYTYDPVERIVASEEADGTSERFRYTATGDLLRNTVLDADGRRRAEYADLNYVFDPVGNLIERRRPDGNACFEWNELNRLTRAVVKERDEVSFGYDALNRRVEKRIEGRKVSFFWDQDHLQSECRAAGSEYLYSPGQFTPLVAIELDEVFVFNPDPCGHPLDVLRGDGILIWSLRDGTPNSPIESKDSLHQPFRFAGHYHDSETILSYSLHRYFDPAVQAFISIDPLRLHGGHALYRYAPNVWNWTDPLGLHCGKDIALGRDPYFKMLANQVGAVHWKKWADEGITRRTVLRKFGRAFHQAAERAKHIHFALDEMPDEQLGELVRRGRAGFNPATRNMTNAELHHIVTNPHLLEKTTFYRNGVPLTTLPDFGV